MWFRPSYLTKIDPLISENWQEPYVDLRFTGFNEKNHPKVVLLIKSTVFQYSFVIYVFLQEFRKALDILRTDYYTDTTNANSIKNANIDLMSDLVFGDSILKGVILQANANANGFGEASTYFFRLKKKRFSSEEMISSKSKFVFSMDFSDSP